MIDQQDQRDLGGGQVEFEAIVELKLLIGIQSFRNAKSRITYLMQVDAEGDYHVGEERESPIPGNLPIGELRAQVLEDRGGTGG